MKSQQLYPDPARPLQVCAGFLMPYFITSYRFFLPLPIRFISPRETSSRKYVCAVVRFNFATLRARAIDINPFSRAAASISAIFSSFFFRFFSSDFSSSAFMYMKEVLDGENWGGTQFARRTATAGGMAKRFSSKKILLAHV